MAKLIPAANEASFEEVVRKIRQIEEIADELGITDMEIDVSDGTFTQTTVWHEPKDLLALKTDLGIAAHLMIADMDTRIQDWLIAPVKRVIFHFEAAHDPAFVIEKCREAGKEVGLALNPETELEEAKVFFESADLIMILGVHPGASGQGMLPGTVEKIRALRKMCPGCIIEVDGGVKMDNVRILVEAGADYITATSAIFKEKNVKKAVSDLKNAIE